MPKVGIVMGSDSDMKVMGKAADMLEKCRGAKAITVEISPDNPPK